MLFLYYYGHYLGVGTICFSSSSALKSLSFYRIYSKICYVIGKNDYLWKFHIFEKYFCTFSMQFFLKVLLYLCTSWEDLLEIVGIIPFSFLGFMPKP